MRSRLYIDISILGEGSPRGRFHFCHILKVNFVNWGTVISVIFRIYMIQWHGLRPILHILNFIKNFSAYVGQRGFATGCYIVIKLKPDFAFLLHKLNNLFIYIMCMFMYGTWSNICTIALKFSNIVKVQR